MNRQAAWTAATDVEAALLKLWDRGRILSAKVGGAAIFPVHLRVRGPDSAALAHRFGEAQDWIRSLEAASRSGRGFGFDLIWRDVRHRQLGRNRVPFEIVVPTEADGLRLLRKQGDARRFDEIVGATTLRLPELLPWLARRPLVALQHGGDWHRILSVVEWFRDHPSSGLYLRQLDIEQVDTKFIETRRGLLSELLDIVLARDAVGVPAGAASSFESRYGLLSKPAVIRFRLLGTTGGLAGLTDISTPVDAFARLELNPQAVFITENEVNGLAFPEVEDSIVLFGLGYGLDVLAGAEWLRRSRIIYWGDIDTHGFAMLARLRSYFPAVESVLMDEETLSTHRPMWVHEERPFLGELVRLSDAERGVFEALKGNRFGDRIRLEQERIAYRHLLARLHAIGFDDAVASTRR